MKLASHPGTHKYLKAILGARDVELAGTSSTNAALHSSTSRVTFKSTDSVPKLSKILNIAPYEIVYKRVTLHRSSHPR